MNENTASETLGRRMDRFLRMRRAMLWTHVALGILSGAACTVGLILFLSSLSHHGGPSYTRGGGSVMAAIFFFAVLPLIVSYLNCADREAETFTRFATFLLLLIGISIIANIAVLWILLTRYSAFALLMVYTLQFSAYTVIGKVLLEPGPNSDDFDW
jgi:hypothetical protein